MKYENEAKAQKQHNILSPRDLGTAKVKVKSMSESRSQYLMNGEVRTAA